MADIAKAVADGVRRVHKEQALSEMHEHLMERAQVEMANPDAKLLDYATLVHRPRGRDVIQLPVILYEHRQEVEPGRVFVTVRYQLRGDESAAGGVAASWIEEGLCPRCGGAWRRGGGAEEPTRYCDDCGYMRKGDV